MLLKPLATAIVVALLLTGRASGQAPALEVATLLDNYAEGRFDDALRPISNASIEQARKLRADLMTSGRVWIDAAGPSHSRRLAIAAMFALELEAMHAERGQWTAPTDAFCAGRCVIEWACALLHERGDADRLEHDWYAATVSLASGVRDWAFLYAPIATVDPFGESRGHLDHASARFPGDAGLRFARALAMASRFEVTIETDAPRDGVRLPLSASAIPLIVIRGPGADALGPAQQTVATRRGTQRALVIKELAALAEDPALGASARIRLAHLQWTAGDYDAALAEAETAAGQTRDTDLIYLASYIAGRAAESMGTLSRAETLYAAALTARPDSQSAALALAALLFQRGDAAGAYSLAESSLTARRTDDDPWRLFQYGDYATLGDKIQSLRRLLTPESK